MNSNPMNSRNSNLLCRSLVTVLGLTGLLLATSGRTLIAGSADSSETLTGTWSVQVTLRDCTTDLPIGPPINSLVTFHEGGTLSESAGGLGFAIGQRSPGHGIWTKSGGHVYHQKFIALINFDTPANLPGTPGFDPTKPVSPGFFAGWQTVTHTVELDDANHLTSEGTNTFYKTDGTSYRTGCSTAVAKRFR
jgi:hypothetical protein